MHWEKVILGAVLLGVAFGYLFPFVFRSTIDVCVLGNPYQSSVSHGWAVGYATTCEFQLATLTSGMMTPFFFQIFLVLTAVGSWILVTGIQSRSLLTLKTNA